MMARKLVGILPLLVALVLAQPVSGQSTGHVWSAARPDAQGPASVKFHRTVAEGELQVAVRYLNLKKNGTGWDTDSLSVREVWALGYEQAPGRLSTRGFALDLMYGLNPDLTVAISGTFGEKSLEHWANSTDNPSLFRFYETENSGLSDVSLTAIYSVVEGGSMRAFLHGGISIPLGSVDSNGEMVDPDNLNGNPVDTRLPYQQQMGSGTFDLNPGFTVDFQNDKASFGFQGNAVIRIGENGEGWSHGNVFQGYTWAGFQATDYVGAIMGLKYVNYGDITGMDENIDFTRAIFLSPAYESYQAGWRIELPIGLNVMMPDDSPLSGHNMSVEFMLPIHQKLDQPSFRQDTSIVFTWTKALGL